MESRPNVWLSVDWDYFVRESLDWDWGHGEGPRFWHSLWGVRASLFQAQQSDLVKETSLRHARPYPGRFWRTLQRLGYDFSKVKRVVVVDSHRLAFWILRRDLIAGPAARATRIVHFDAHHDLVYRISDFQRDLHSDTANCGDWLLLTLYRHLGLHSLIVYPAWKGLTEWRLTLGAWKNHKRLAAREVHRLITKRVDQCVWGDPKVQQAAGQVEFVFVCRSSGWTPPWHDRAFRRFALNAGEITDQWVDTPFVDLERIDPLECRAFDWSIVRGLAILGKERLEKLRQDIEAEGRDPF